MFLEALSLVSLALYYQMNLDEKRLDKEHKKYDEIEAKLKKEEEKLGLPVQAPIKLKLNSRPQLILSFQAEFSEADLVKRKIHAQARKQMIDQACKRKMAGETDREKHDNGLSLESLAGIILSK